MLKSKSFRQPCADISRVRINIRKRRSDGIRRDCTCPGCRISAKQSSDKVLIVQRRRIISVLVLGRFLFPTGTATPAGGLSGLQVKLLLPLIICHAGALAVECHVLVILPDAFLIVLPPLLVGRIRTVLLEGLTPCGILPFRSEFPVSIRLGDIGLQYARLAHAVGAYVIGVKRRLSACPEGVDELCLTDELDTVLPRADVVCSFLPGTASTYHLFNDERYAKMKPSAYFINCGRGTALDGEALCRALEQGVIAGAAADVTEIEPLPADHPLWKQRNMIITPHISGGFHLPVTLENIVSICLANFAAYLKGEELRNVIDFTTGYKK